MKKLTLFLVAMFAMVNIANAQRAWAYDLGLSSSGDSYEFTFKAVTAANATLVFYQDGFEVGTLDLGAVAAGQNTFTKTSAELLSAIQKSGDFTWGVKMTGSAIAAGSTLTEVGSADFYNMMGVVVDNNPESSTFSQIYIQQAYEYTLGNTAERNKSQKAGIFIYDQQLNELNNPNNKGIVPNVPDAYKAYFGKNRDAMKRLAINPKTGQLAFCYNITLTGQAAAVWAMDLEELTPTAGSVTTVNLIDGITAFSKPNSLCFGEDGTLFVLADGGYNATSGSLGSIYKITDGKASVFSTFKYANGENAMASDGKGGLWVAQQRNNLDDFSAYTHHKADGEVDYTVTNKSSDEVKSLFQHTAEYMSKRGAIAYDVKRDILAVGGDKKVILFSVAYDATTGAPTLTKLFATPTIGGNIDGIAFDYAGDVYVVSSSSEKFQKFAVPTNNNTCTVPAKKVQVITLVSATPEYNVTINVNGNGTVTGANTGKYLEGTELTLTATPAEHHEFTGWTGDVTSTENLLTITVNSDMTVTANFAKKQYTLTVLANDAAKGDVNGSGTYEYGTEVVITATPKSGYEFVNWSNGSKENPLTIKMEEDTELTANFRAVLASSITLNAHPVKDYSASIVGTMKRAIQNGENMIVLTHEDDGTPHIYNIAHTTKTVTEISQEGVVAVDPDNAGDYLAISDIALTEDGKLIACNYMRCSYSDATVGTTRYYIWNDLASTPSEWFTSSKTANSTLADVGYTFAVKGNSDNAQVMTTAVHNNNRAARINLHTVVNGTEIESAYHRFGLYTTASEYTEAKQGVNFQLTAVPLDGVWALEGELTDPTSFAVPSELGAEYNGTALNGINLGKKYNGANYLDYNDHLLMVAPYAVDGKLAGVKVLGITDGFDAANLVITNTDLANTIDATSAAATAYVDGDDDLTIYLIDLY